MEPDGWRSAQRILCVRLDALGDVLMTAPAMRALKAADSGRHITLLASPAGAEIARFLPEVDDLIVCEVPWMKASTPRADVGADLDLIRQLREGRFDAAAIFTVYSQNPLPAALFCYLAEIPLRLAHCRENPYQLLTHWVIEPEPERLIRHEVRRQLELVAHVGCQVEDERIGVRVSAAARERVVRRLICLGVDLGRQWVLVHPGASAPSRRYPGEKFAEATRRLVRDDGLQVIFSGGPREQALVESIRADMQAPSFSIAGDLGLGELIALISISPLLISNNTGPAHIAAAVATPIVDLYALTNPQHTPWRVAHRVLSHDVSCKYCYKSICPEGHHNCLTLVRPDQVADAARELLAQTAPRSEPPAGCCDLPSISAREPGNAA